MTPAMLRNSHVFSRESWLARSPSATRMSASPMLSSGAQTPVTLDWLVVLVALVCTVGLGAASAKGLGPAVFGLVAAGAVLTLTARPRLVGAFVLATVPATSGLLRGGVLPVLKISEAIVVVAAALVLVLRPLSQRLPWSRLDTSVATFALLSVALGASHLPSEGGSLSSALRVILRPMFLFVIYRIVAASIRSRQQALTAVRWGILTTVPVSLLTLAQFLDVPGVRDLLIRLVGSSSLMPVPGAPGSVRATGPFPIWHSLDGYLLPFLFLIVCLVMEPLQAVLRRPWLFVIAGIDVAALISSLTLAAGIGLTAGVVLIGFMYRRPGRVVLGLVITGALATAVFFSALQSRYEQQFGSASSVSTGSTPQTLTYRLQVWHDQFLPFVRAHPLVGYGNQLPPEAAFQHTDNEYLTLLLRGGFPLLLGAAVLIVGISAAGLRLARASSAPEDRALGRAVAVATICPVAMGVIWPYITNAGFGESWLGLAGVVAARLAMQRSVSPAERHVRTSDLDPIALDA